MGDRRARGKRAGFCTDHADFDDCLIRSCGPDERCSQRGYAGIFQQVASSHVNLPKVLYVPGNVAPSFFDPQLCLALGRRPSLRELLASKRGAFRQRLELRPGDLRMHAAAKPAVGRGDDVLGADRFGEAT